MAPSSDQPTSADKGKGKAVDSKAGDDKKAGDAQSKANGKKDEDKIDCVYSSSLFAVLLSHANSPVAAEELSEEDQQLKSELDMLVERLTV